MGHLNLREFYHSWVTVLELKSLWLLWQIPNLCCFLFLALTKVAVEVGESIGLCVAKFYLKGQRVNILSIVTKGQIWLTVPAKRMSCFHPLHLKVWKSILPCGPYQNSLQVGFCPWVIVRWPLLLDSNLPCAGSACQALPSPDFPIRKPGLIIAIGSERVGWRVEHQQLNVCIQKWHRSSLPLWLQWLQRVICACIIQQGWGKNLPHARM